MPIFALILLIVFALVVLTGFILSLVAGLRIIPYLPLPFPAAPEDDSHQLLRTITVTDSLWHPGRGDLTDPTAVVPAPEFPIHPME